MTRMSQMPGLLIIVSTPIGNLEDITFRAVKTLQAADLIAAEDTRRARILLSHYNISCRVTSYHKDNESRKTAGLLKQIKQGRKIALLVDAGTPCLSDPGYLLVRDAIAQGLEPLIIPGASALTYAAAACGFPVSSFYFAGYLPKKKLKRRKRLAEISLHADTFFLFESPYRICQLLGEIAEEIGPDTRVVLIREATKVYEEHIRGSAKELLERFTEIKWKGEFTVAVTIVRTS
jgi:16S rRNA (cytidine1402-2'-O)-methyltransferase